MPMSLKIQPINGDCAGDLSPDTVGPLPSAVAKPVVKSRLKRLFRISFSEKDDPPTQQNEVFEPSSVCLGKMVQNFIEESNEKQSTAVRCGRNRCNCFNGNGSDGSDAESENVSATDVCEFLKSLVGCCGKNEKNVLGDTTRIVMEKNKGCKKKDELRKIVIEGLVGLGYDAALCKSKWEKSPSFPAGEYEYVDVIIGGERLIIDIDFRSEFEVARSTKTYKSILQTLPNIFVGKSDRLSKIICILSEATKQSLKKKGMHIPPWRKLNYVQAKWLSPPTRLPTVPTTTPPSPLISSSGIESNGPSPEKLDIDESDVSQNSPQFEPVFEMSESSGEEDVKDQKKVINNNNPKVKIVTGLASIMEEKQ